MGSPSVLHHQLTPYTGTAANIATNDGSAYTPTLGNLLVVITSQVDGSAPTETITDNQAVHNAWKNWGAAAGFSSEATSMWTAPVTVTNSGFQIVATGLSNGGAGGIAILEITGCDPTNPVDGANVSTTGTGLGTNANSTVNGANTSSDLGILGVILNNTPSSVTWNGGLGLLDSNTAFGSPTYIGAGVVSGTGIQVLSATLGTSLRISTSGLLIKGTPTIPNVFKLYSNGAIQANVFTTNVALPTGIAFRLGANNVFQANGTIVQNGGGKIKFQANGQMICNNTIVV